MKKWLLTMAVSGLVCSMASAQEMKVFFGNLHSHSAKSDGSGTPEQAYKYARDTAKVDFLLLSEHNHRLAPSKLAEHPELYEDLNNPSSSIATANRMTQDGRFVALYGQEFSTHGSGNHINVFDIPKVIPESLNGKFDELLDWLAEPGHLDTSGKVGLIQLNHPWASSSPNAKEYGRDDFSSVQEWVKRMGEHSPLIEVANGPHKVAGTDNAPAHVAPSHFISYLNLGFRVGPTANQDNHLKNWGNSTTARTGILAPQLTKTDLIAALRARHVFATTDMNLDVIAKIGNSLMGDVVDSTPLVVGNELPLQLSVLDRGEVGSSGSVHYIVDVYSDEAPGGELAEVVEEIEFDAVPGTRKEMTIGNVIYTGPGQYIFVEVNQLTADQDDADRAWTAPFWFEPLAPALGGGPTGLRIASALPNSATPEGQTEEVSIQNAGAIPVDLQGWTLRDSVGAIWRLDTLGMIAPGATETIRRSGQAMSLNNNGDTLTLVNPDGIEIHTVSYDATAEGVRVQF